MSVVSLLCVHAAAVKKSIDQAHQSICREIFVRVDEGLTKTLILKFVRITSRKTTLLTDLQFNGVSTLATARSLSFSLNTRKLVLSFLELHFREKIVAAKTNLL